MENLKLVSFALCPFVQRSVAILKKKKVPFEIEYIDLNNPPDWFLEISPFGQVPILQVGKQVLFESSVIAEYLDEICPPSMQPQNPLDKAVNRAWTEFAASLFMGLYRLGNADGKVAFEKQQASLHESLKRVEQQIKGPFFNGDEEALVDLNFAPFFTRAALIKEHFGASLLSDFPKLQVWSDILLKKSYIQNSVPPNFATKFIAHLKSSSAFEAL